MMTELDERLCLALQGLQEHKLRETIAMLSRIYCLGHVISSEGIIVDPTKVEAIMEWPVRTNLPEVRIFMGLAGYFRWFVEGFSRIANLIMELQKNNKKFLWTGKCTEAF
jgi:hypothetical protein